jgi:hypothetical protein
MKKFALLLALVFAAGIAVAEEKKAEAAKPAGKTHEVSAEIVSVDAVAKTVTIKGDKENKTVPVEDKALADVKNLKAGQKVTLICVDDEMGAHKAVAGVKAEAAKPLEK